MGEPFSSSTVKTVRYDPGLTALALLLVFGAVLAVILVGLKPAACIALFLAAVVAKKLLVDKTWPKEEQASVQADAEGVRVNGELVAPRDRIRYGLVVPDVPMGAMVRIERRMALPLEIRVRDEDQGRQMLMALGLDVTQRSMTFTLPSRARSDFNWSIPTSLGLAATFYTLNVLGQGTPLVYGTLIGLALAFFFLTFSQLTVGADGLLFSWLGQKRFWRYDDIASIDTWIEKSIWKKMMWEGIELRLRTGERVKIGVQMRHQTPGHAERLHVIFERVRAALNSHREGDPAADAALLGRGERDVGDWIRTLRAMGSGAAADHRTAPVAPERLWRIVEDPRATPEARAGAATALGTSLDAEGRARLESAAAAVAAPRLRIALEAAASEDEEALREALEAMEVEEPRRRARAGR
jgi:hypothetical protein